ncbi:MAG: alpha/beta fold hydrolase [Ignavibacteria bacterium]|nr:alpha/beta fold hydrolase [Ignavibacteria bacterium]
MKYLRLLLIVTSFLFNSLWSQQKFFELGNFKLESGDTVYDCKIGYRTFGKLNKEKSNAVLYSTWFGGTSQMLGNLIGGKDDKNKLLDSTNYFIICVDALGNGISTSPSNSLKQRNEKFPKFTMRDIVATQYKLLTEEFGIKKLYAAIGGSMGSMQSLQLAVSYPNFVQKVVAYVPTPWSSSYDMLLWSTREQLITSAHQCGMSEKEIFKSINMLTQLVARTPDWYVQNNPREKFDEILKSFDKDAPTYWNSYDYLYQLRAMISHDISSGFNSKNDLKSHIQAEIFLIIATQDHILHPSSAIEFAKIMNCKTLILDDNCGHLSVNCNLERVREEINLFLNK